MILVVGGTGTIGRELVRLLAAAGTPFRALLRNPGKAGAIAKLGGESVIADLTKPRTLAAALIGIDKAFLVAPASPRMAEMRANFIAAAVEGGVQHLVMSTALGADPDGGQVITRWHGENEQQVRASGIDYTFLQPNFFMQIVLMQAKSIGASGRLMLPLRKAAISFIDARDIAAVALKALSEPGHRNKSYRLTGPQAVTCGDIADILSAALGRQVSHVDIPLRSVRQSMVAGGAPESFADAMTELFALAADGGLAAVHDTVFEVTGSKARDFPRFAGDHAARFTDA